MAKPKPSDHSGGRLDRGFSGMGPVLTKYWNEKDPKGSQLRRYHGDHNYRAAHRKKKKP